MTRRCLDCNTPITDRATLCNPCRCRRNSNAQRRKAEGRHTADAYRKGRCRCDTCHALQVAYTADVQRRNAERRRIREAGRPRQRNRERDRARANAQCRINRAIQNGTLTRPATCETCGATPDHGAAGQSLMYAIFTDPHDELADLQWLCSLCAGELRQWTP